MPQDNIPTKTEQKDSITVNSYSLLTVLNFPALVFDIKSLFVLESNKYFNNEVNISVLDLLNKYDYSFVNTQLINEIILSIAWGNNYNENKHVQSGKKILTYSFNASLLPDSNNIFLYINLLAEQNKVEILNSPPKVKYLDDIIQKLKEGVCEITEKGVIVYLNESFASIFEKNANELVCTNLNSVVGLHNWDIIKEELEINFLRLSTSFEIKFIKATQEEKIIQIRAYPKLGSNNQYIGSYLIFSDITEKLLIENDLLKTKEKALDADNLKASFLANIPHEIRTPMNSIMGFASILKRPGLTKIKRQQYLDIIISHGHKLMDILNDIIDLTIIEKKHIQLNISPVSLKEIFSEVYQSTSRILKKQKKQLKIKITENLSDENFMLLTDRDRVHQILKNLISNAIKFTESGFIEFGYKLDNKDTIICFVRDTGIGIPLELHNTIFERFRQADESFTRNYGGTGVGLTISRGLVNLLGGKIWVESDGKSGTTFFFTIPYFPVTEYNQPFTLKTYEKSGSDWEGKKVLLIEDDNASSEYLNEILTTKHCQVVSANNGILALESFRSDLTFNLVLLDIQLPDLDGFTIAREIRKLNPLIPIIAQTAHSRVEDKIRCFDAGCNEYLAKPIPYELFLDTVQKYF